MPSVVPILVPRLGLSAQEVTLIEWLVADGSEVREGEPVCTVETEKVENEIVAPAGGTIRCVGTPDAIFPVGAPLGEIVIV
jgi:pyruvate/2-oxoglutarate dehydrogenase complex dihydrolipoamide acyltransferase (E2) component